MELVYRLAKNLVHRLPAWVFRVRPFSVYEIPLVRTRGDLTDATDAQSEWPKKLDYEIRWVVDFTEAATLSQVASAQSISTFDPIARPVAAAWLTGEVIACAWIATGSFEEPDLGLRFVLQPTEAWLFAAVVVSSKRGHGVYGELIEFICDELDKKGVRRILLGVTTGNEPSRRANAKNGATRVGSIIAIRSLGLTICFRRGDVRRLSRLPLAWRSPVKLTVIE
jgi:hypothetical protein